MYRSYDGFFRLSTLPHETKQYAQSMNAGRYTACIMFGPRFSNMFAKSCDFVMVNNWIGACAVNIWVHMYILSAQLPSEFRLISPRVVFSVHGMLFLVELGDYSL
jgi:hypothetical protein